MTGETIKSFLVGLGFAIDDASLAKFNKAIATATLRVAALYGSIKLASAGILYTISEISEGFEKMGYEYRIIAPAINKALVLRRELLKAYAAAGINIQKVIQNSVKLNFSLAKTKFAFEAIYRSVASRFFELITKQSDLFRQKLYQNLPKIQDVLERIIKFIFSALDATIQLGSRLWSILSRVFDLFVSLDHTTNGWSSVILGLVAAWKLLNLSFVATPLGLLLTGFTALLALFDDFKTYQEGGDSLIDWGSRTTRIIIGITAAIGGLAAAVGGILVGLRAWAAAQWLVNLAMTANPIGLIIAGVGVLIGLLTVLAAKLGYLKGVGDFFSGIGDKILGTGPLGVGGNQNSVSTQNVQQQTSISVVGSADANAVGKAVAGEQNRVNFDLSRNLKGATR